MFELLNPAAFTSVAALRLLCFVPAGNICRSPTAEAMFRSVVEKACLGSQFDIDSCGTGKHATAAVQ
jgi:protein-tyrosine-phosphatase